MSFRFFKRVRIAPGVTVNLSKSGGSVSVGPRGAKMTVGKRGVRQSVGIPGTGLYHTTHKSWQNGEKRSASANRDAQSPVTAAQDPLTLGFFKKLFTPDDEKAFVNGLKSAVEGDEAQALVHLLSALHIADAAFMAGFLSIKQGDFREALTAFERAEVNHSALGSCFGKYGITLELLMPITEEVAAHILPDRRGLLLGLVEAAQALNEYQRALDALRQLRQMFPDDVVVQLSLAELFMEIWPDNHDRSNEIVHMTASLNNDTPVHTALLLYKARALRTLGLFSAARDALTTGLRRKKHRSDELLRALRYERALVYEELGQNSRARTEFEKLYAEAPTFADVASRLNI